MFNEKDILARLQNGECVEDILSDFNSVLNEANATYKAAEEAKKKAAEAKAKSQEIQKAKVCDMADLLDYLFNYLSKYYPEHKSGIEKIFNNITSRQAVKIVDELIEYLTAIKSLSDKLSALEDFKMKSADTDFFDLDSLFDELFRDSSKKKTAIKPVKRSSDQILEDFLKENKW